jgi:hypothetical protein
MQRIVISFLIFLIKKKITTIIKTQISVIYLAKQHVAPPSVGGTLASVVGAYQHSFPAVPLPPHASDGQDWPTPTAARGEWEQPNWEPIASIAPDPGHAAPATGRASVSYPLLAPSSCRGTFFAPRPLPKFIF